MTPLAGSPVRGEKGGWVLSPAARPWFSQACNAGGARWLVLLRARAQPGRVLAAGGGSGAKPFPHAARVCMGVRVRGGGSGSYPLRSQPARVRVRGGGSGSYPLRSQPASGRHVFACIVYIHRVYSSCIFVAYCHVSSCIVIYRHVSLYLVAYISSYIVIYRRVSSCTVVSGWAGMTSKLRLQGGASGARRGGGACPGGRGSS